MEPFARIAAPLMIAPSIPTVYGDAAQVNTASAIENLMAIKGVEVTCYRGEAVNASGTPYVHRACHLPNGEMIASADYGDQYYIAQGQWRLENGTVCVTWRTDGWTDGCHRLETMDGGGHRMIDASHGTTSSASGHFFKGVPGEARFQDLWRRLSS